MKDVFREKFFRKKGFGKKVFPVLLAATMVLGAGIGSASAYFTAYTEAQGGIALNLGNSTTVEDSVEMGAWRKSVSIKSDEGSEPVYVRAKVYFGSGYALQYGDGDGNGGLAGDYKGSVRYEETLDSETGVLEAGQYIGTVVDGSGKWTWDQEDQCFYYSDIVYAGEETDILALDIYMVDEDGELVKIPASTADSGVKSPEIPELDTSFNVIVVYECALVLYNEENEPCGPKNASWDRKVTQTYEEANKPEVSDGETEEPDDAETPKTENADTELSGEGGTDSNSGEMSNGDEGGDN